jgi:hypothetical protein
MIGPKSATAAGSVDAGTVTERSVGDEPRPAVVAEPGAALRELLHAHAATTIAQPMTTRIRRI